MRRYRFSRTGEFQQLPVHVDCHGSNSIKFQRYYQRFLYGFQNVNSTAALLLQIPSTEELCIIVRRYPMGNCNLSVLEYSLDSTSVGQSITYVGSRLLAIHPSSKAKSFALGKVRNAHRSTICWFDCLTIEYGSNTYYADLLPNPARVWRRRVE
jgi:hypothetical protein